MWSALQAESKPTIMSTNHTLCNIFEYLRGGWSSPADCNKENVRASPGFPPFPDATKEYVREVYPARTAAMYQRGLRVALAAHNTIRNAAPEDGWITEDVLEQMNTEPQLNIMIGQVNANDDQVKMTEEFEQCRLQINGWSLSRGPWGSSNVAFEPNL